MQIIPKPMGKTRQDVAGFVMLALSNYTCAYADVLEIYENYWPKSIGYTYTDVQ